MDRELVERARAGDHDAFTDLAQRSVHKLFVIARLILRDDGRADDATQETLVAAWKYLPALRDPDRFDAWLHRLLVNACYSQARRDRRRRTIEVQLDPLPMPEASSGIPFDVLLAQRDQLERGFRRLDADQRVVLVLHYYLGYSMDDAGEVLGIPPGTVRSRLHRARAAMRTALEADARGAIVNEAGTA